MSAKAKAGAACAAGTMACAVGIVVEGLRFDPNGSTAPMTVCVALFWTGLALLAVPVALTVRWFFRELRRELRQAGLTPAEAALAQLAGMSAVEAWWAVENHKESERLAASVMGLPAGQRRWPAGS